MKMNLDNWKMTCKKKDFGGLGVPYLADLNMCLLGSWVKRYIRNDGEL
jgi:hypothetical protein